MIRNRILDKVIVDRLKAKASQQIDHNIINNREVGEYSDAKLTAMLKECVIHAPIDDKPRSESDTLN